MTTKSQQGNRTWGTVRASRSSGPTHLMDNFSTVKTTFMNAWFFGVAAAPPAGIVVKKLSALGVG